MVGCALMVTGAPACTLERPYNTNGPPEESNPFGVAALPDNSVLVSDAANNDLLRVSPGGRLTSR